MPGQGARIDLQPHVQNKKLTCGSTNADYLTARIAKVRPDVLERMKAGEFRSVLMSRPCKPSCCRNRLKSLAYQALDCLPEALPRRVTVRAHDHAHRVAITAVPVSAADTPPERFPGLFFSPVESAIFQALSSGPAVGKEIAKRIGQPFESSFRTILRNLLNRRVLRRAEGGGYAAATVAGDGKGGRRQ
jgi:hypothetical protein